MLRLAALVPLLLVALALPSPSPAAAVVGGRPADAAEWPWQVALLTSGQQFCGGTLLSPRHVLTAAHCTDPFEAADIEVLAGTVSLDSGGERRAVATIHQHEQWDDFNLRFDIALLELAEPFVLGDAIGLASLATDAQVEALGAVGSPLVVTGFGATGELEVGSRVLLEGELEAVDDTACLDVYREHGIAVYAETQICAVGPGGRVGSCYGDSGGPLVAALDAERTRWVQLGVVSWGAGCSAGNPTVYTEVWAFVDWLAERGVAFATGVPFEGAGTRIPARGTVGKADQYPLALDVQGFEGVVGSVAVRFVLSHPRASDLDIRLVAPDGTTVTVLSDAGGDERFEEAEVLVIQAAGPREAGAAIGTVVGPTDHEPDPQWPAAPPAPDLGQLVGLDPNGRWELLIADDRQGASGTLESWSLVLG
jgi:trypsin